MSQKKLETLLLPTLQFYVPVELVGRADVRMSVEFRQISDLEIEYNAWIGIGRVMCHLQSGQLNYYPEDEAQINEIINAMFSDDLIVKQVIEFIDNFENYTIRLRSNQVRKGTVPLQ